MLPTLEQCYRAVASRDPRFDGWIYVGVTSTGIYCRPSCPAVTPKRDNVTFHPTVAAAQEAGFRACRRCLPDATPGSPEWDVRADIAARAMRLVDDGVIEREGVAGLASRLGYTTRHLGRVLVAELGAGPLALARARRAHTARLLLETTTLPVTDVAFAAGFGSVRQFNDTIRAVFAATPSEVRDRAHRRHRMNGTTDGQVRIRLPFRAPYDTEGVWRFLADRLVDGVEAMQDGTYRRAMVLHRGHGVAELTPARTHVEAVLHLSDLRDLGVAVARCRRLLHLDADPAGVLEALGGDDLLGPLVRKRSGLRVPGSVDPFETAIRAVIGQQVSVSAARTVASRLVRDYGEPLTVATPPDSRLTHVFPRPDSLAEAGKLPMPESRGRTIRALSAAVATGVVDLDPGTDRAEAVAALLAVPGIGPWTAQYVALRGLGDPDAFPGTDLGIRRALVDLGVEDRPATIEALAERWRPLRSYAAQHLWTHHTDSRPDDRLDPRALVTASRGPACPTPS
ncbi:MAG TPA: AlkA N-terminal domain-containing protein [Actinopolymorphaceae bacterium]